MVPGERIAMGRVRAARWLILWLVAVIITAGCGVTVPWKRDNCHPSYPTVCIPPPPPDLDCKDIRARRFLVLPPDPHRLDADWDGIGCER